MTNLLTTSLWLTTAFTYCGAECYFSPEVQGEYVMQSSVSVVSEVQYSTVNITESAIPVWGNCHRRIGNNVILVISSGGTSCFRCFHLKLRSLNVLQVLTAGKEYIYKCDTNEETAIATCPSGHPHLHSQLVLFKTRNFAGGDVNKVYCPISGRYSFTYDLNDGSESKVECSGSSSYLTSCPSGSQLHLHFKQCSFQDYDMKFECLGNWDGPGDEKYLALVGRHRSEGQSQDQDQGQGQHAQYRCAMYEQQGQVVHVALSNDSTCSGLTNTLLGFETMTLRATGERDWPQQVYYSSCKFPEWMHGSWEHLTISDSTILYRDHVSFKTYTIKCVGVSEQQDKYVVFGRTQCDEEMYSCLWIAQRSANVLEFRLGSRSNGTVTGTGTNDTDLCSEQHFGGSVPWLTQARLNKSATPPPCPIAGEYTGLIPDTTGLCAKLSSDCTRPELMHYEVSECRSRTADTSPDLYEQRQYRCLGQWQEDGLVYTYTQRQDLTDDTYECFVGFIVSDREIYIKEAGDHCQRYIDPLKYGMKLTKQLECFDGPMPTTIAATITGTATKPWTPVTYATPQNNENAAHICDATVTRTHLTLSLLVILSNSMLLII